MNYEADSEVIKQSQEVVQSVTEEITLPHEAEIKEEHSLNIETVGDCIPSSFEMRLVNIKANSSELKAL